MKMKIFSAYYGNISKIIENDVIVPIQGGAILQDNQSIKLKDSIFPEISKKNDMYNEFSVLYVIWKYYSKDLEYESFGNVGFLYKEKNFDIENKSLKGKELNFERYRDNRDEMNVERISKEDFLKELEIIVNAYEDIYNDNEVQKMFENFKENF